MSQKAKNGIYMVCGIQSEEKEDYGTIKVEGVAKKLFTIPYKDASIVAMEVPMKVYPPNKDNLMMHQKAVSQVMKKNSTVIPVSFGNVFHSKGDVKVLLENLYPQFQKLFPEIKGKIEVGLKVLGKQEWLDSQISKNPKLSKIRSQVADKSKAANYYERIEIGGMAKEFFMALGQEVQQGVFRPLENLAVAAKINEPLTEKMLLNAAFLIDKEKEEEFDRKVNEVYEKWENRVDFNYSGPWPAYNFVNIRLKVEDK